MTCLRLCVCVVKDRVLAAKSLILRLRTSRCSEIIQETNRLCIAYVELANYNVDKYKGKNGGKLLILCVIMLILSNIY